MSERASVRACDGCVCVFITAKRTEKKRVTACMASIIEQKRSEKYYANYLNGEMGNWLWGGVRFMRCALST